MGNDDGGEIRRICEMIEALTTYVYRRGGLSEEEFHSLSASAQQLKTSVYMQRFAGKFSSN
jgi:hypothetical protein